MNGNNAIGIWRSFVDWVVEMCVGCQEHRGERDRLHRLSVQKHHHEPCTEMVESTAQASHGSMTGYFEKDNCLAGQLMHGNHDEAERHNRRTVTTWLHGDPAQRPNPDEVGIPGHIPCGHIDYRVNDTRLIDYADIGMGMDLDCLSCFIGDYQEDLQAEQEARKDLSMRKTTKDIPAMKSMSFKKLEFHPLDASNRQSNSCE